MFEDKDAKNLIGKGLAKCADAGAINNNTMMMLGENINGPAHNSTHRATAKICTVLV